MSIAQVLRDFLTDTATFSARYGWFTLCTALVFAAASLLFVVTSLQFNSDKESLVAETAPFKHRNAAFDHAFPQFLNSLIIVIDTPDSTQAQDLAELITMRLKATPDKYQNIYFAEGDPFFRKNGLLYLSPEELEERVDLLANAEPGLAAIAANPTLEGIFDLLDLGMNARATGETLPPSFEQLTSDLAAIAQSLNEGRQSDHFGGFMEAGEDSKRRIIMLQPTLDYSSQSAERTAILDLRQLLDNPAFQKEGVRIRLTGRVALADDEIWAIQDSVFLAGILSTLFAGTLLGFALRSWRLIAAILTTLFIGLLWTMGFATLSVGSLNMISAAVVVLFIGLGIDHSIHVSLRYREARQNGDTHLDAVRTAAQEMGGAVALCATTSAIAFAAFIPTEYRGLAELGVIAAGSLFLAFVASFTVLPALLTLLGDDPAKDHVPHFIGNATSRWLTGHSMFFSVGVAVAALIAIAAAGPPQFDFSTLAIRDAGSESVTTLLELQADGVVTDYAADVLVSTYEDATNLAVRLSKLPEVGDVFVPATYVPDEQDLKLDILSDAEGFLWPALTARPSALLTDTGRAQAVAQFTLTVTAISGDDTIAQNLRLLSSQLTALGEKDPSGQMLREFETRVSAPLLRDVDRLRNALAAEEIAFDDLPSDLRSRVIGAGGEVRVTAVPSHPLFTSTDLEKFVDAVRSVAPEATGRALTEADVGALVVQSFYLAGMIAFVTIAGLLLVVLRSSVDAFLVLVPLALAACFTIASANFLGVSFNFANIIVLPLIFGLGIDSGIHFVLRRRHEKTVGVVMQSSTPQAIVLSALSTLGAFSALSLSRHWGLASMGLLLTIAIIWVIFCTVIVLPALIAWRDKFLDATEA
ncbi:MMPL family transporter [Parvibaculaceae bacterium PLY_AMNH_Bact1]|nr:MMPL family transporter [Parvibaculaceae bacterium PLY_AMNH_Bact1]